MAAVLSCGPTAVLSHRAAGALWGIADPPDVVDVSVRTGSPRGARGLRLHRRSGLDKADVSSRHGIPVTAPEQTLVDLAAMAGGSALERAVNEAFVLGLANPETLLASLENRRGRRGAARLRALLEREIVRLTDSELERCFLRLVRRGGLPPPCTGTRLAGHRVDFHWPEIGLVVETDGLAFHRSPAQQARDRRRDQDLTAAGLTLLRFTNAQVRREPDRVTDTLMAVMSRLRGASP